MVRNPLTPAQRRAQRAARRIPNAPHPQRAQRIHAWAEFVKAALRTGPKP